MSLVLSRPKLTLLPLLVGAFLFVATAEAASGPSLLAPSAGKHFGVAAKITFKVRDRSTKARKYGMTVVVNSKRTVKHGELQMPGKNAAGDYAAMKRRKHGVWTYTPPSYTYPSWYMRRRGTYYWQSFHIDCFAGGPKNCHIVSKIRTFRVG
jgi:hypothetical protein